MPLYLTYPNLASNEQSSVAATACAIAPGTVLLTVTPQAGTYLVVASVNITATSAAGRSLSIVITVGGTAVAHTNRVGIPQSAAALSVFQNMGLATNAIVTVNGAQAIAILGTASLGTMTVTERTMDLLRLV